MAVPKRRKSRSRTHSRRSQWKTTAADLVPVTISGKQVLIPRRLITFFHRHPEEL
ncbi:50S ribosomal protein L32 [Nakamurella antarctica]|uniref:Large ribosomal subunit protein bL32 n=1 Tax=Nakamurella antarctica TaxID=1902245 RepID=A0A3G8ZNP3_9ACTN|nr:50S ribosomal protein L32 [Nakamurella antarctica]AZI58962.1 50S ribosomal protein L32 [Nakamurella antarctica]